MSISVSARYNEKVNYTITDTLNQNNQTSKSDSLTVTSTYTYGTGDKQINNAVTITGCLSVSGSQQFDFYNGGTGVLKVQFGVTGGVPLNVGKHITVLNTETTKGANIEVSTTGANNLNGIMGTTAFPTGSQVIYPYSAFTYNDPFTGTSINDVTKKITLNDIAGSGACYKIIILGVDFDQPTGVPGNPYA